MWLDPLDSDSKLLKIFADQKWQKMAHTVSIHLLQPTKKYAYIEFSFRKFMSMGVLFRKDCIPFKI